MNRTGIRLRVYHDGTVQTVHDIEVGDTVEITDDNGDFLRVKFDAEDEIALYFPGEIDGKKRRRAGWLKKFWVDLIGQGV